MHRNGTPLPAKPMFCSSKTILKKRENCPHSWTQLPFSGAEEIHGVGWTWRGGATFMCNYWSKKFRCFLPTIKNRGPIISGVTVESDFRFTKLPAGQQFAYPPNQPGRCVIRAGPVRNRCSAARQGPAVAGTPFAAPSAASTALRSVFVNRQNAANATPSVPWAGQGEEEDSLGTTGNPSEATLSSTPFQSI